MAGLVCLNHQHALKLSALLHDFEFLGGYGRGAVRQIIVECDRFELKTFDADEVGTFLALATSRA